MGEKLVIGPINRGLRTDRKPFNIDNDSFPTLVNAYQWRGRVKRKRGTSLLNRLQRSISATGSLSSGSITLSHPIRPGTINIIGGTDGTTYTDPGLDGNLLATGGSGTGGTINYSTGVLTINSGGSETISGTYTYYPVLPVMGLEDFILSSEPYPQTVAFDTTYSYSISTSSPYNVTDITFYKNPPTNTYPGYTQKTSQTPFTWNGQNYQQFWTVNYQNALWVINGVTVPFNPVNMGMQFAPSSTITYTSNTSTTITLSITNCPLIVGDFVFMNEWGATTENNAATLNFQTGFVTAASPNTLTPATKTITITFPDASLAVSTYVPGIVQYLTNTSNATKDNLRWYDGTGWVNFCPPLSQFNYTIEDSPQAVYYLINARLIIPFKDRLLFFGPVIQTSKGDVPIYLQDCVIYSQNGTPFYTADFTLLIDFNILNSGVVFHQILTPNVASSEFETATPMSYWEDQFGFGGNQPAGIDQAITTVSPNEDALIVGFNNSIQTRFVYTGNDIIPFAFYIINAELGSGSTFSAVTTDDGVISKGPRGFIITSQTSCRRIDMDIIDQVFQISNQFNGAERFCSQRDFINEWIYFTYPSNSVGYVFPTQTLQFNYRDNSWAIFNESYTTYGSFRFKTGYTWGTIKERYKTWGTWNVPWNSGQSTLLQPKVIAGNAQGFVLVRDEGTGESTSLFISSISANTAITTITSPNHCLNTGDYILISNSLGTIGSVVNNKIFSVKVIDNNTFTLNPGVTAGTYTYLGNGTITRLYVPQIYSKQFPAAWDTGRKTRIGVQQYLFTRTANGQLTLLIFLSQNSNPSNNTTIVPDPESENDGLIYSTVLYTCPESTNLGLTPANTNLQQATSLSDTGVPSNNQQQIWHRMNTSLIGDTVQFGFTLNDAQMRDINFNNQMSEIEFHGAVIDINPSSMLS